MQSQMLRGGGSFAGAAKALPLPCALDGPAATRPTVPLPRVSAPGNTARQCRVVTTLAIGVPLWLLRVPLLPIVFPLLPLLPSVYH